MHEFVSFGNSLVLSGLINWGLPFAVAGETGDRVAAVVSAEWLLVPPASASAPAASSAAPAADEGASLPAVAVAPQIVYAPTEPAGLACGGGERER